MLSYKWRPNQESQREVYNRVARWYFFKTKISYLGKFLLGFAMVNLGIFYYHLLYFNAIGNI
jgi:hypothetical protein